MNKEEEEENKTSKTIFTTIESHKIFISVSLIIIGTIWIIFFHQLLNDFGLVQQGLLIDLDKFILITMNELFIQLFIQFLYYSLVVFIFISLVDYFIYKDKNYIKKKSNKNFIKPTFKESVIKSIINLCIVILIIVFYLMLHSYWKEITLFLTFIFFLILRYKYPLQGKLALFFNTMLFYTSLLVIIGTLIIPIRYYFSPGNWVGDKELIGKNYEDMIYFFDKYKKQTGFPKLMRDKNTSRMYYFVGMEGNNYYFYDVNKSQKSLKNNKICKDKKFQNICCDIIAEGKSKEYIIKSDYLKPKNSQIYIKNKKDNLFSLHKYEEIDLKYIWDINCTYTNNGREK